MMLAYAEYIEADLIGEFNLFYEIAERFMPLVKNALKGDRITLRKPGGCPPGNRLP